MSVVFKNYLKCIVLACVLGARGESGEGVELSDTSTLPDLVENTVGGYVNTLCRKLEEFNDHHFGKSYLGRLIRYDEIKPKSLETARQGKSIKKMSMAMMPLVFHVGATSTWLLLTAILTAKSVAIGLALLVFKIAVSAAKVSSFFTTLKNKQGDHHYHGHDRSMTQYETTHAADWSQSHNSLGHWSSHSEEISPYKTIPDTYMAKEPHGGYEYADETNA